MHLKGDSQKTRGKRALKVCYQDPKHIQQPKKSTGDIFLIRKTSDMKQED